MSLQGCKLNPRYLKEVLKVRFLKFVFRKNSCLPRQCGFLTCIGLSTLSVSCHHVNMLQDQYDPETFSGSLQVGLV